MSKAAVRNVAEAEVTFDQPKPKPSKAKVMSLPVLKKVKVRNFADKKRGKQPQILATSEEANQTPPPKYLRHGSNLKSSNEVNIGAAMDPKEWY